MRLLVVNVVLATMAPPLAAKTVYVSTSGCDVEPASAGSSADNPLCSVVAAFATLAAGDTVLLKKGDFWSVDEPLHLGGAGSNTTAARGVSVGAYGPDAERPLLTGTATTAATAGSALVVAVDQQALHFSGISFALAENALTLE
jgi:hypothetical protein